MTTVSEGMNMKVNDYQVQLQWLKYGVYVVTGLYVSWRVMAPPRAALPYEVLWVVSNPLTKILLLLAIYASVAKEPVAALLLTIAYILVDYDLYVSAKFYHDK